MISIVLSSRAEGNLNHRLPYLLDSIKERSKTFEGFEVLMKFDLDEKGHYPEDFFEQYPFTIKTIYGERWRGYLDIHKGYKLALQNLMDPKTTIISAVADDFVLVEPDWVAIVEKAFTDYHIVHTRPGYPTLLHGCSFKQKPDWEFKDFGNLFIVDENPFWSRRLLEVCDFEFMTTSDCWTIGLEKVIWERGVSITSFLDRQIFGRCTNDKVDSPHAKRWNNERRAIFDFIASQEFDVGLRAQAQEVIRCLK